MSCELAPGPTGLGAVSFLVAMQAGHGRADAAMAQVGGARLSALRGARGLWDREREALWDSESEVRVHNPRAEFRGSSRTLVVTRPTGRWLGSAGANPTPSSVVGAVAELDGAGPPDSSSPMPGVDRIHSSSVHDRDRARTAKHAWAWAAVACLVTLGVVYSVPFQMRRGEGDHRQFAAGKKATAAATVTPAPANPSITLAR